MMQLIGPLYSHGTGNDLVVGMRAEQKHCNLRGHVHGGMLATLADIALTLPVVLSTDPPTSVVTASLTVDYAGQARVGDWLETRTDVQRQGNRHAFINCYIYVGEQRIVRASGVFVIADRPAA